MSIVVEIKDSSKCLQNTLTDSMKASLWFSSRESESSSCIDDLCSCCWGETTRGTLGFRCSFATFCATLIPKWYLLWPFLLYWRLCSLSILVLVFLLGLMLEIFLLSAPGALLFLLLELLVVLIHSNFLYALSLLI